METLIPDELGLVSYCLVIYYQKVKSYNAGSAIKFLNAQSIALIELHHQLRRQSFPAPCCTNYRGALVHQVGPKATDTRTQNEMHGVSIVNCGPSFLTSQEIPVRSVSALSE